MSEQQPAPRQIVANEAAKQSVAFAFAVATIVVMAIVQRKMHQDAEDAQPWLPGSAERRMRQAQRDAQRWDKIAAYLFRVDMVGLAKKAHQRAEAAREAYERERP